MEQGCELEIETESEISIKPGRFQKASIRFYSKKNNDKRPYTTTGPLKYKGSYNQHSRMDIIDIISSISTTGRKVFIEIKNNRCIHSNIVDMSHWQDLSKTEIRFIQRGLKDLYSAGLVSKTKTFAKYLFKPNQYTLMINPYMIKPNDYDKAKEFWCFFTGQEKEFI